MTITSYNDLTATEKIVYSRYLANTISETQLDTLVSNNKIRAEAAAFMRAVKSGAI